MSCTPGSPHAGIVVRWEASLPIAARGRSLRCSQGRLQDRAQGQRGGSPVLQGRLPCSSDTGTFHWLMVGTRGNCCALRGPPVRKASSRLGLWEQDGPGCAPAALVLGGTLGCHLLPHREQIALRTHLARPPTHPSLAPVTPPSCLPAKSPPPAPPHTPSGKSGLSTGDKEEGWSLNFLLVDFEAAAQPVPSLSGRLWGPVWSWGPHLFP